MTASLEVQLSEILFFSDAIWIVRAGDRWGRVSEKITVMAGRVPVWVHGAAYQRRRRFTLICHFEIDVASGSTVTVQLPSKRLAEDLTRVNLKLAIKAALAREMIPFLS